MHALVNGIQLAYEEHGSGPAVVLLHDLPYDRQMWQAQVEPLVGCGFRVVLPDLRGIGES
ncbi:MAG: alpha/beta hydrolase, partial [Desulfuromonas sp.]